MHTCSTWSEDVHVILGLSSHYFLSALFHIFYLALFPGLISIGIDTLWSQLLEFSTNHFETMKLCIFVLHCLKMCVWFWVYLPIIRV